jgi:hypothetical protein
MLSTSEFSEVSVMFYKRSQNLLNLLLKFMKFFLLGYDSNSHAYCVFNVTIGCVEITCDVVFVRLIALKRSNLILIL